MGFQKKKHFKKSNRPLETHESYFASDFDKSYPEIISTPVLKQKKK
jgi:hypothetical protein